LIPELTSSVAAVEEINATLGEISANTQNANNISRKADEHAGQTAQVMNELKASADQIGKIIKVIDRDWGVVQNSGKTDPRALFWKYWYGIDLIENRESWAVIPQTVVAFDSDRDDGFWSDQTLEKLNR